MTPSDPHTNDLEDSVTVLRSKTEVCAQAHDRNHALGAGHPVIKSLPLTEGSFTWCYSCERYV